MGHDIRLPFGGSNASFDTDDLVTHIQGAGRDFIIQGQQSVALRNHTKPQSLDVWLRRGYATNPDTKQATNEVVEDLVDTGVFREGRFKCPDSGRTSKGIELVTP